MRPCARHVSRYAARLFFDMQADAETRAVKPHAWRTESLEGIQRIVGYAAMFNVWSEDLGGFREMIKPGAFQGALLNDVRALVNHDPSLILGRTSSGTLFLNEDDIGLRVEIALPDTSYARDVVASVQRGDMDQMSFAFSVKRDDWMLSGDQIRRTILEIERLYDVSLVTYPAYPQTSAVVRSKIDAMRNTSQEAEAGIQELQARFEIMRMRIALWS